ncbi:MAG: ATP-binding cassette domain-containing protein [bacterium]|nr:ATP-binding cassette domain-containing protein [bacterium]
MFTLNHVSIAYGNTPVLQDVSFQIEAGEKVVLIGASGAGKTTLLRKLYEMQQDRAVLIHQDYALTPQLSVFHNVCAGRLDQHSTFYNLLNLIHPKQRELDAVTPLLEGLGMADKCFDPVHELSGGQQQRTAIARAIYRGTNAILGDEPVSSVDPHQAHAVLNLLKQKSSTLVLAMHDVQLALEHFDRILGLRLGRLVFDLPSNQVSQKILTDLYKPSE